MDAQVRIAIVSCSLNTASRSHRLALAAHAAVASAGGESDLVDIRESELPICDGGPSFDHPGVEPLRTRIEQASAVLIAAPVYNYDLNAAAKNLVEMTGSAWNDKVVGFLCAAGGDRSYMSPISFANSLMFDFRCVVIPRFVYCTKADFDADGTLGEALHQRVDQLATTAVTWSRGLAWARRNPPHQS